jgi:hypothetical protein
VGLEVISSTFRPTARPSGSARSTAAAGECAACSGLGGPHHRRHRRGSGDIRAAHLRFAMSACGTTRNCCRRCWRSWRAGRLTLVAPRREGRRSSFQDLPRQYEKAAHWITNVGFAYGRKPAHDRRRDRWVGRRRAKMSVVAAWTIPDPRSELLDHSARSQCNATSTPGLCRNVTFTLINAFKSSDPLAINLPQFVA